jgi:hypothetical protein
MEEDRFPEKRLRDAIEALLEPGRFEAAEQRVARAAPDLQRVLAEVLAEGGWFDAAQGEQLGRAASLEDLDERLTVLRTMLAEEARIAMMVGVAVGWELARELEPPAEQS